MCVGCMCVHACLPACMYVCLFGLYVDLSQIFFSTLVSRALTVELKNNQSRFIDWLEGSCPP